MRRAPITGVVIALGALLVASCAGDSPEATTPTSPAATASTATPSTRADSTSADSGTVTTEPDTTTVAPVADPAPTIGGAVIEFDQPVDMAVRSGDDALFIVERAGRVVAWRDDETTTVLDIADRTVAEGERGLLGLAFSPDGDRAWVNYTDMDGDTVIAEYPVASDGDFDDARARTVLTIDQPHPNHNGGDLAVGPDGLLYIGMGDGGSADDPDRVALDPSELLGKILRIDPTPNGTAAYSIPGDNPFVGVDDARAEVWAIGVRNPWRFDFDAATGDLWIADVGQGDVEEIDALPAVDGRDAGRGVSLGWSAYEGDRRFNEDQSADGHLAPLYVYTHDDGRCSVSGGTVYRGSSVRGLDGWYVFGDWCTGEVWALEALRSPGRIDAGRKIDVGNVPQVVNVVAGHDGELWALSLDGGVHPIVD